MTAPLTPPPPPHEPSPHDAWPPPGGHPRYPGAAAAHVTYGQDGPGMKTELREAAVVTVAVAVAGVVLGLLWVWLAPSMPKVGGVVDGKWVVVPADAEGEQAAGADGTFTLLAMACGAVSALAVFAWRRRGSVPLVVALAVGGFLASLLAWRLGMWLGPAQDVIAAAKAAGQGETFSGPLKLTAKGAWLAWPVAALVVHLGLTALFGPRDPEPYAPDPYPKQHDAPQPHPGPSTHPGP
ncbi:AAA family ATPase [Streptomyces sp. NPDC002328]|uniref:AAA family ATPase n=1 Tax=Streptomyces sp. NPDC002328 TaxID=3364642 RepID=UPI0036989C4F